MRYSPIVASVTTVAAIDCGTHTIRLLVARVADDGRTLVDAIRRMEVVRLGEGVDRTGRLAPSAIERTRVKLAEYASQIADLGAERVRMVATSASRDAENAEEFQTMVCQTLGHPAEVVTGDMEARLSFAGALSGVAESLPGPFLVFDIGGGSTEFVLGDRWGDEAHGGHGPVAISVDIGCLRLTERYLRSDPPTADEISSAVDETRAAVDRALRAVPSGGAKTLIGLAGSVTTVTGIALGLEAYRPELIHGATIERRLVAEVTAELLASTRAERAARSVIHPGRADVIAAGALILRTILEQAGFEHLIASEHDILDGIALSLVGAEPLDASNQR